jgi:hypothetical protein
MGMGWGRIESSAWTQGPGMIGYMYIRGGQVLGGMDQYWAVRRIDVLYCARGISSGREQAACSALTAHACIVPPEPVVWSASDGYN